MPADTVEEFGAEDLAAKMGIDFDDDTSDDDTDVIPSETEPKAEVEDDTDTTGADDDTDGDTENTDSDTEDLPDYEPNYSYKVQDVESVFDDRFKAVIKTKEDEDFVRDMYQRAEGLKHVKDRADKAKGDYTALEKEYNAAKMEHDRVKSEHEKIVAEINHVGELGKKGDVLGALRELGFDNEAILKAAGILVGDDAVQKDYDQKSKHIQAELKYNKQLSEQQKYRETQEQRNKELYHKNAELMLDMALTNQDVQSFSEKFSGHESVKGMSFRDAVIRQGQMEEYNNTFIDIPTTIRNTMNNFSYINHSVPKKTTVASNPKTTIVAPSKKTSLPNNVKGNGTKGKKNAFTFEELVETNGVF